jgi:glutathione-independent formaldehyde dehydrogenase
MKALVCYVPRDVRISEMLDAKIEQPTDVLVPSDLHIDEERTGMEAG